MFDSFWVETVLAIGSCSGTGMNKSVKTADLLWYQNGLEYNKVVSEVQHDHKVLCTYSNNILAIF